MKRLFTWFFATALIAGTVYNGVNALELPRDWEIGASNNDFSPPDGWPENMAPSDVNNSARELMAVVARWATDTAGILQAGGVVNALEVTTVRSISTLYDGMMLAFEPTATNTTGVTINVNSSGAKPIKRAFNVEIASAQMVSGQKFIIAYDGDNDWWQLMSPAGAGAGDLLASNNLLDVNSVVQARSNLGFDGASKPITAGDIANNAIDLSEMAHQTQGDILVYQSSGAPAVLAAPVSGQALMSAGSGADTTWGHPQLLETVLSAGAASIDMTVGLTGAGNVYRFLLTDIVTSSDDVSLILRASTDGGSTFTSKIDYYGWGIDTLKENGGDTLTSALRSDSSDSGITLRHLNDAGFGTGTNEKGAGWVDVFNPAGGNTVLFEWHIILRNSDNSNISMSTGFGVFKGTNEAIDSIQFLMSTGNISGSVSSYRKPK